MGDYERELCLALVAIGRAVVAVRPLYVPRSATARSYPHLNPLALAAGGPQGPGRHLRLDV